MSKWKNLLPKQNQKMVEALLENEMSFFNDKVLGPYYCDHNGRCISVEDAADPDYDPYVLFKVSRKKLDGYAKETYVYHPNTERYYIVLPNDDGEYELSPKVSIEDIPEWAIKEIFTREPTIYDGTEEGNGFNKFVMPLIKKSYPNLISNNLISVQPMTQPTGSLAFYKAKYGVKCGKKNDNTK